MEFLARLEESGFSKWISESGSLWGYPAILFLHTIGLATVAGVNAGINLRVLGFAPQLPLTALLRFFSVIWIGFAVTAASGVLLLITDATTKLTQPIFYIKMLFVALALANVQLLKVRVFADGHPDERPLPANLKLLSLTSLFLWLAATTAGRLMAYVY